MQNLKCIVVDDSLIFRKVMRDCLAQLPDVDVIDVASDGNRAIEKIIQYKPDLVTLDVEMPGRDGIQVLQAIREAGIDADVIVVSSRTHQAASVTTRALALGAFDYILKPDLGSFEKNMDELFTQLEPRVKAIRKRRSCCVVPRTRPNAPTTNQTWISNSHAAPAKSDTSISSDNTLSARDAANTRVRTRFIPEVIGIGISTGGPAALRKLLPQIDANFPLPILIVQHMPPLFTNSLARDLNSVSKIEVCEAVNGQVIRPGVAYIAPGGTQMRVSSLGGQRCIEITDDPPVRSCKPSVDYLFASIAESYGSGTLALVMTGMGNDGTDGCRQIKARGGHVVAQEEASCTVYGMPRQVVEAGLADRIESLDGLAPLMNRATIQGAMLCL